MPPRRDNRWLCVAEKPSVAEGLAKILGNNQARRIQTRAKYNCERALPHPTMPLDFPLDARPLFSSPIALGVDQNDALIPCTARACTRRG